MKFYTALAAGYAFLAVFCYVCAIVILVGATEELGAAFCVCYAVTFEHHFGWTLHVAGALCIADLVRLGTRPLEVKRRHAEPEDSTAARFAAMELT